MPRINKIQPTHNTITTASPNAPIRDKGATSDILVHLGKTGEQIGEALHRASVLAEKTKAQNFLDSQLRDIQTRAANDNDLSTDNLQKYRDEIDQSVSDASEFIKTPFDRTDFELQSASKANISHSRIGSVFTQKKLEVGKAELDIFMDNKRNEYVSAVHPMEKEQALIERDTKINEAVDAGYLDPAQAKTMKHAEDKKWSIAQVDYDIDTDPYLAKKMLEQGAYKGLGESEKIKLKKQADAAIKARAIEMENDVMDRFIEEDITVDEILQLSAPVDEGGLGPKKAEQYARKLETKQNRDITELKRNFPNSKKYVKLVEKMIDDRSDSFEFKQFLVDVFADGVVDKEESKKLRELKNGLKDLKENRKGDWFKNSANGLLFWARNKPDAVIEASLKSLIHGTEDLNNITQDQMEETTKGIIREQQGKINPNRNKYQVDQVIQTPSGSYKVVGFDDDGEPLVSRVK